MLKAQWNNLVLNGVLDASIPQDEIERMIDNSYRLVVSKMTKNEQQEILVYLS